jgi:nitrogen fixation protein NifQ
VNVIPLEANGTYRWLVEAAEPSGCDEFDIHVVASIMAVAIEEASGDESVICDNIGLEGPVLVEVSRQVFPAAADIFERIASAAVISVDEEEQSLRDILVMYSTGAWALEPYLAAMIARRCKFPHHLWQDLGLRNRGELSRLMQRHFNTLATRNSNNMKWKKFLYRLVCRSEGFSLCVAPVCSDCNDFVNCFGSEDGESILARIRNG